MLTTEFQYEIGKTIRRLQDRVAQGGDFRYNSLNTEQDAKDRLDESIIALLRVRLMMDRDD